MPNRSRSWCALPLSALSPINVCASNIFSKTVKGGDEVVLLEDDAYVSAPEPIELLSAFFLDRSPPSIKIEPLLGCIKPPKRCNKVVFRCRIFPATAGFLWHLHSNLEKQKRFPGYWNVRSLVCNIQLEMVVQRYGGIP